MAWRRRMGYGLLATALAAICAAALAWWNASTPGPAALPVGATTAPTSSEASSAEDQRRRALLLGVWEDDYHGRRTMTLRDDQTATMLVELSGMEARLFTARLRFDMTWSLAGDRLRKRTTGGEPADKVDFVLKMMGDTAEDTLVELDDEKLVLRDADGKTVYRWRRAR